LAASLPSKDPSFLRSSYSSELLQGIYTNKTSLFLLLIAFSSVESSLTGGFVYATCSLI